MVRLRAMRPTTTKTRLSNSLQTRYESFQKHVADRFPCSLKSWTIRNLEEPKQSWVKRSTETQRTQCQRECSKCDRRSSEGRQDKIGSDVNDYRSCNKREQAPWLVPRIGRSREVPSPHFPERNHLKAEG